jgi:hypothetical protein
VLDSQQIGDVGESAFQAFVAPAGLLTHAPSKDRNGWDTLLELNVACLQDGLDHRRHERPFRGRAVLVRTVTYFPFCEPAAPDPDPSATHLPSSPRGAVRPVRLPNAND